jgi:Tol biopolymer transport system component
LLGAALLIVLRRHQESHDMTHNPLQLFATILVYLRRFHIKDSLKAQTALRRNVRQILLVVFILLCAAAPEAWAAAPLSDTLSHSATTPVNWVGTATGPASSSAVTSCREGFDCDTFILTYDGTTADWAGKTSLIRISWQFPTTDYDLYIIRELPNGQQYVLAQSTNDPTNTHATHEEIDFSPAFYGTGRYLVRVMYAAASFMDQYSGSAVVAPYENSCRVPGLTVLSDMAGDSVDSQPNHDIESVSIAEPYMVGTSKLVFTMKVAGLESLSTQTFWRIYFRTPNAIGERYFVDMRTITAINGDNSIVNQVSYKYGTGDGVTLGDADEGHYNPQAGTITITISRDKIGNPQPNQSPAQRLEQIYAQVIFGASSVDSVPNRDFDLSQAQYTIVGNSTCNAGKVAFITNIDGNNEVYVMDAQGTNPVNMTSHTATEYSPSWSPDGRKLTFASSRSNSHDIFAMDSNGSNLTNLTNIQGSDLEPSWSPDGKQIAFVSWRDTNLTTGTAQLYVMNPSGTNQTRLTFDVNNYRGPSWSPDGRQIAFWGGPGRSQIYVINANGTNMRPLTTDNLMPYENIHSAWSPDGSRIAFSSNRDGDYDIYVMNSDGSNVHRVMDSTGDDFSPAWSPDGMCIVFTSNRNGNAELYAMNADGSNQTRLTNSPATEATPAWQPVSQTVLTSQPAPPAILVKTSDFDGDNKDDIAIFRPSNSSWQIINSLTGTNRIQSFGQSGDVPVPGDYDGDGKTDLATFTPRDGSWQIFKSQAQVLTIMPMGQKGDYPAPGDYDGDGKTDIAFFRPVEGKWYIFQSSNNVVREQLWGTTYDRPAPGDYDGDGRTDIAVWRTNEGVWYIRRSTGGTQSRLWGIRGDVLVPADYDGDGKTDIAIFRPLDGTWYIIKSLTNTGTTQRFGDGGEAIVPADYDGDGKTDLAVRRLSNNSWYILNSSDGTTRIQQWGQTGDIPIQYLGFN